MNGISRVCLGRMRDFFICGGVSVIGAMKDKRGKNAGEKSVIGSMMDKRGKELGRKVRHRGDDGQKRERTRSKSPS